MDLVHSRRVRFTETMHAHLNAKSVLNLQYLRRKMGKLTLERQPVIVRPVKKMTDHKPETGRHDLGDKSRCALPL